MVHHFRCLLGDIHKGKEKEEDHQNSGVPGRKTNSFLTKLGCFLAKVTGGVGFLAHGNSPVRLKWVLIIRNISSLPLLSSLSVG